MADTGPIAGAIHKLERDAVFVRAIGTPEAIEWADRADSLAREQRAQLRALIMRVLGPARSEESNDG